MFNESEYEDQIKHKIARRLDTIKESLEKEKRKIKGDKELEDRIRSNIEQASEIYVKWISYRPKERFASLKNFLELILMI